MEWPLMWHLPAMSDIKWLAYPELHIHKVNMALDIEWLGDDVELLGLVRLRPL